MSDGYGGAWASFTGLGFVCAGGTYFLLTILLHGVINTARKYKICFVLE